MGKPEIRLLDGGMGTMLQAAGLPLGCLPELWNLSEPEKVTAVQRQYVEAGSRVLYTNTFGANRCKTAGCGHSVAELIAGGVRCARAAAEGVDGVEVALDVGPIGQLLEPLGTLRFEEAYDIFREMVVAGEEAGADRIVFETMSDLYEVKAAVLAAKENTRLPVWVTMTFEAGGRSFVGVTVPAMALTLTGLGVEALGFNCSLGPKELLPLVEELRRWTDLPLILKPNAGLPDPLTGEYGLTAADFADELRPALEGPARRGRAPYGTASALARGPRPSARCASSASASTPPARSASSRRCARTISTTSCSAASSSRTPARRSST